MDKILETIMNFINENTPLLIIICVFLIFVLIGYLIDNSIKTKKLEKQMINEGPDYNGEPIKNEVVAEETITKEVEPVTPHIDPNTEINLDFRTPEEIERDNNTSVSEASVEELVSPTPTIPVEEEVVESESETPVMPISNEVTVDPAINELLLRDFANNGISNVEGTKTEENNDEVSINPINNVVSIDDMINTPEHEAPVVEPVLSTPEIPVPSSSVVQQEESIYKNDKKLSDIFKKKPVTNESNNLEEKTEDFSTELDKILKKLNEESDSKDSTLGETQDFTNMF